MIIIDQLRVSDDGSKMYITAHVNKASYFNNITIDSITIMTSDKVSDSSPQTPTEDFIYKQEFDDGTREINLMLTVNDFTKAWKADPKAMVFKQGDMCSSLFFVYIKAKGTPDACTPCTLDEDTTVGVTFWENLLYRRVMEYTRELSNECSMPTGFMDFILRWYAFKASIETENYATAVKFFDMLFGDMTSVVTTNLLNRGCGCHG